MLCASCRSKRPPFVLHRSASLYEGNLREIILLYKYGGYEILAGMLARLIVERLGQEKLLWDVHFIVPLPSHPSRVRERGFDHSLELARRLSRFTSIPVKKFLVRKKKTLPQAGLSLSARRQNVKDAFKVKGNPSGLRLLLVDDIYTTGSTIQEASRCLAEAGAEVYALTVARRL